MFFADRFDAPDFDVAVVYGEAGSEAEHTTATIVDMYRCEGRRPRIRLSPGVASGSWSEALLRNGFTPAAEQVAFFTVPPTLGFAESPAVTVTRAFRQDEAEIFSSLQVSGFGLGDANADWDRELTHRRMAEDAHHFYLAWINDQPVGAARCIHLANGVTSLAALATLPVARNQGVGTSLLARMTADARHLGSEVVTGTVHPGSPAARMYEGLGFNVQFVVETFVQPA